LISTYVDYKSAEAAALQTVKKILEKEEYPYFSSYGSDWNTKISQQDIYNWVNPHDDRFACGITSSNRSSRQ
jgi:hypothetical protein